MWEGFIFSAGVWVVAINELNMEMSELVSHQEVFP